MRAPEHAGISRSSETPVSPDLKDAEMAAIAPKLEGQSEELRKCESDRLVRALQPWIHLSKGIQRIEKDNQHKLSGGAWRIFRIFQAALTPRPASFSPELVPPIIPGRCIASVAQEGTIFTSGFPVVEATSSTGLSELATSALAAPTNGDISLAVRVGRLGEIETPGKYRTVVGDSTFEYNYERAHIAEHVFFPSGPIAQPVSVEVTVDVNVGSYDVATTYLDGASSDLVGVCGLVTLALSGLPAVESPRASRVLFLCQLAHAHQALLLSDEGFQRSFSLSETLYLLPPAAHFDVRITAELCALRSLADAPGGGYALAAFTTTNHTEFNVSNTSGGPINVPRTKMKFCHFMKLR